MKTPPRQPALRLHRVIPSRLQAVESLGRELRAFLEHNGLREVAFPVELSARECLNNAVLHGNRRAATKRVEVDLRIGRRWIRLQVTDEGAGFNWRQAHAHRSLNPTVPNGRGLAICTLYVHRVVFNQRSNRITLWLEKHRKGN